MVDVLTAVADAPTFDSSLDTIPAMKAPPRDVKKMSFAVQGKNLLYANSIDWGRKYQHKSFEIAAVQAEVRRYLWRNERFYRPGNYTVTYSVDANDFGLRILEIERQ